MTFENILMDHEGQIATITINRPTKLNALNKATIQELSSALEDLEANDEVRVVILTGSGEKAFVAGADIKEFADFNTQQGAQLAQQGQELLFDKIESFSKPVIAAVNGFALGGGLELAMAAHFRLASDNARMGLPEVSLGVIPGYGGTQRLPQLIGKGRAMQLIMTAQMIDAATALDYGLVNEVTAQEELMPAVHKIASKILRNSPHAISQAIDAVNRGTRSTESGYEREVENFGKCFGTPEFVEGTTAFLEKRKASF